MSDAKDSENEIDEARYSRVPACDACKARKIKCDRKDPCSSCQSSKINCRTTKRAPEKRQRVLISSRYEQEIASVNEKLDNLSKSLALLLQNTNSKPQESTPSSGAFSTNITSSTKDESRGDSGTPFEGGSSFNAHSKRIAEAFEFALGNSPQISGPVTVTEAAKNVQKLLSETTTPQVVFTSPSRSSTVAYPELSELVLPPMASVLKILKYNKENPARFFFECHITTVPEVNQNCQRLYFPTDDYSIGLWINVHCVLYFLFDELDARACEVMGVTRGEVNDIIQLCANNLNKAFQSLRLYLDPTLENIEALVMMSIYSMEIANSAAAWTQISLAARMALDTGLHQLPKGVYDPLGSKKRKLFWFIYSFDHGLALNFGRTPNVHDYDITTERFKDPEDIGGSVGAYYQGWIDFAQLQGEVYEQLYSGSAQMAPQEVKTARARALAKKLTNMGNSMFFKKEEVYPYSGYLAESIKVIEIVIHCVYTLIYRMIPPDQPSHPLKFCDDCLSSARKALQILNSAWLEIEQRDVNAWRVIIHWTLLYVPFVPFIVVFGNTIAECNRDDLALLENVVATMDLASKVSSSVDKLRLACSKFHQIASAYLAQMQQSHAARPPGLQQSDAVPVHQPVSALGLPGYDSQVPIDFTILQQDWNGMLDDWDLGVGAENAREMTAFFEQYMTNNAGVAG